MYYTRAYFYLIQALALGSILFLPYFIWSKIQKKSYTLKHYFLFYVLDVYLLEVLLITRIISSYGWHFNFGNYNLQPNIKEFAFQNILNVIMFLPFGLLLPCGCRKNSYWKIILSGLIFSLGIETIQLFFVGRLADINDILANTLGTVIGCGLHRIIVKGCQLLQRKHQTKENA